jgi:hypothetical protein
LVSFSPFVSKEFFLCEVFPFCVYILFAFIALLCLFLSLLFVNALVYVLGCARVFGYQKEVSCFTFIKHHDYSTMHGNE